MTKKKTPQTIEECNAELELTQKKIRQIFDVAFSLQGFHEQRMPFILRLLGCVLLLPYPMLTAKLSAESAAASRSNSTI